jgi:hypothetical protein
MPTVAATAPVPGRRGSALDFSTIRYLSSYQRVEN